MTIKECYIENFGALSDYHHCFDDGLNVFYLKNGAGKTTLSVFLRSMLFGMEAKRAKDSVREKYRPWQGGNYGGYIIFSSGGKLYRLQRYFKDTEAKDTFELFDVATGLVSTDFSKELGRELFKTDRETFAKTAYIPQGKTETAFEKSGGIISALSADGNLSDDKDYDKAQDAIAKAKTFYEKRGGGKIAELCDLSAEISAKIAEIKALASKRDVLQSELFNKKTELNDITKIIREERGREAEFQKQKAALLIKEDIAHFENEIARKSNAFKKMPTEAELSLLKTLSSDYDDAFALCRASKLTDDEQKLCADYEASYGAYTAEDISNLTELSRLISGNNERKKSSLPAVAVAIIALLAAVLTFRIIKLVPWILLCVLLFSGAAAVIRLLTKREDPQTAKLKERYFSGKKDNGEIVKEIEKIQKCISVLDGLKEKESKYNLAKENANCAYEKLGDFASQFSVEAPEDAMAQIEALLREIDIDAENLSRAKKKLSDFAPLSDEPLISREIDIDELEKKERILSSEIFKLEAECERIDQQLSEVPALNEKSDNVKDELEKCRSELNVLLQASEALTKARQSLGSKYAGGIKKFFSEFSDKLKTPNGVDIDADFDVNVAVKGEIKPLAQFSTGERDATWLALRFAVIPAIYKDEMPPVILDDPLVNFDDEKRGAAIEFIKSMAEQFQIIYFTCDKNRADFN